MQLCGIDSHDLMQGGIMISKLGKSASSLYTYTGKAKNKVKTSTFSKKSGTNFMLNYQGGMKTYRPQWAGVLKVDDYSTSLSDRLERNKVPRMVSGIVIPVKTKGRKKTPSPSCNKATGSFLKLDRGHLMALMLGGSNIPENVAPQTSWWQQLGDWSRVEKTIFNMALKVMKWKSPINPKKLSSTKTPQRGVFFRVSPSEELTADKSQAATYSITATSVRLLGNGNYCDPQDSKYFYLRAPQSK